MLVKIHNRNAVVLQGTVQIGAPNKTEGTPGAATEVEGATTMVALARLVLINLRETREIEDGLKTDSMTTEEDPKTDSLTITIVHEAVASRLHHSLTFAKAAVKLDTHAKIAGHPTQNATTVVGGDTYPPYVVSQNGKTPQQAAPHRSSREHLVASSQQLTASADLQ